MRVSGRSALGVLLSAGFLYLAFRNVPLHEVRTQLGRANLPLFILSALAATAIFPLRARRWRPILDPIAPGLPFATLWRPTAIGMMINNVVPARAGEPARAYALARTTPVPFPAAFASLAVDRLFDMVVVFVLMFLAMLDPAFPRDASIFGRSMSSLALGGLALIAVAVGGLYTLVLFPARVLVVYEIVARRIAPTLEARGRAAIESLVHGLGVLRSPGRFGAVFFWAVLHWLVNGLAFWIGFRAVGIDAPFSAGLFLQGLIAIGVAAPQAPGFFGVFEYFGMEGLRLYGVPPERAVTFAIGFHFLSFVPITVLGAYYFLRAGLTLSDVAAAGADAPPRAS